MFTRYFFKLERNVCKRLLCGCPDSWHTAYAPSCPSMRQSDSLSLRPALKTKRHRTTKINVNVSQTGVADVPPILS